MAPPRISLDDVQAAIRHDELFLEYMPAVSLEDGRCVGAEALLRWRRPSGVVPPNDFIPVVEGTHLSGSITYWVLDRVAVEMKDWLRANPRFYVAVNVPPEILGRGGMEYVARKSGLLEFSSQVVIEITERGVPDGIGLEALENMWRARMRVALDDVKFAGGPNLAILSRSPFSMLKLDRSLVAQIRPGQGNPRWLAGVSALLHASRLDATAEGVETQAQADALRQAGVRSAQGFLYSRPVPAAEVFAFARARPA